MILAGYELDVTFAKKSPPHINRMKRLAALLALVACCSSFGRAETGSGEEEETVTPATWVLAPTSSAICPAPCKEYQRATRSRGALPPRGALAHVGTVFSPAC